MNNSGSLWLERTNLQQSECAVKMCALAALELEMALPLGVDAFPVIWEGNIPGKEPVVQSIRRCLICGSSVQSLLRSAGITTSTLTNFVKEIRSVS